MKDQASRTEPLPRAAEVLQAGTSDKGPVLMPAMSYPARLPMFLPLVPLA